MVYGRPLGCDSEQFNRTRPVDLVVSPIAVTLNTQSGGNAPTFTPGQVVDALVMRLIDQTHVQLAIGNALIDVQTAVPLQPGAHVQLAVRATPEGLRLVLLHPDEIFAGGAPADAATARAAAARPAVETATANPAGSPSTTAASPQAALAQAVRSAAVQQDGLAPLLANVAAAMKLAGLPDPVRAAAAQLLAFRLPTDEPIKADDVARALARSGLFLEAGLAGGAAAARTSPAGDMKAALVALRAALAAMVGRDGAAAGGAENGRLQSFAEAAIAGATTGAAGRPDAGGAQALYRALAQTLAQSMPTPPGPAAASGATLPGAPGSPDPAGATAASPSKPPPPYRGAAPAAQPPLPPTLGDDPSPQAAARTLLAETDAALARHTLMQAASLPDPGAAGGPDQAAGRFVFEIPFATPQGTTIAQFEIARDGKSAPGTERQEAVWRARFALDIEPVGVVHAQITVAGARTGVTLWAERGASAALLRDHAADLAERLRAADLDPSEVLVRDGSPPRPRDTAAPAGRFLDRAS